MRVILLAAAALALGACNKREAAPEQTGVEDDPAIVTASGNDVTAIDAATSDDANMAADAEVMLNDLNMGGNEVEGNEADRNSG